jgi:hypothetical protein
MMVDATNSEAFGNVAEIVRDTVMGCQADWWLWSQVGWR